MDMSFVKIGRVLTIAVASLVPIFLLHVTVSGGLPTVWAPRSLLGIVAALTSQTGMSIGGALVFIIWNWNLVRDPTAVPERILVAAVTLSCISAIYFLLNLLGGATRFNDATDLLTLIVINACFATITIGGYMFARSRHIAWVSLLLSLGIFSWVTWQALPWLGELP
jgi:hypothetical protein